MESARKCRWCANQQCPYPKDEDFALQLQRAGRKWLEEMPCWVPFPENIGKLHDQEGNYMWKAGERRD